MSPSIKHSQTPVNSGVDESARGDPPPVVGNGQPNALDTALDLLTRGYWPIAIYPRGAKILSKAGDRTAEGKEPIGAAWGAKLWTPEQLRREFNRFPDAGVGICFGPGRGPGGSWLVDAEGDGPEAPDSLGRILGGETLETPSWGSTRGDHTAFTADGERLLALLAAAGASERKGTGKAGVWHLAALPGLEFRVGGFKPDGVVKQVQSVCPPTPGTNGTPRTWRVSPETPPAALPESAYACLAQIAEERRGKYGRAALASEVTAFAQCTTGNRHAYLLGCTLKLASLVKANALDEREAFDQLHTAAVANGMIGEGRAGEVDAVWSSAMAMANPREIPIPTAGGKPSGNGDGKGPHDPREKPATDKGKAPKFTNFTLGKRTKEDGTEEDVKIPRGMAELDKALFKLTDGWPRRVGKSLFRTTADFHPIAIDTANQLFSWLDTVAKVNWGKGSEHITQERLFEHLRDASTQYDAVASHPHWPPLPGVFYLHAPVPPQGDRLDGLLEFFRPASNVDRDLLMTLFMTPFWGGRPGSRPAFLITGPDDDPEGGRGTGKSTAAAMAARLAGGSIDVSPNDLIAAIKTRLLSDGARHKRIVLLDNIKTHRFSWGDLEALITAPEISGHAMYRGEGCRTNDLMVVITLNGASLSKDMAQRSIPIKLDRPKFQATWEQDVCEYIAQYRWEILSDIRHILQVEHQGVIATTRWSAWEVAVLSKVTHFDKCQKAIAERQGSIDDDNEESVIIAEFFAAQIKDKGWDPETCHVLIPSQLVAEWLSLATRKPFATNTASTHLNGMGIAQLKLSRTKTQRGWVWKGENATAQNHSPV